MENKVTLISQLSPNGQSNVSLWMNLDTNILYYTDDNSNTIQVAPSAPGPQGLPGEQGIQGIAGAPGRDGTNMTNDVPIVYVLTSNGNNGAIQPSTGINQSTVNLSNLSNVSLLNLMVTVDRKKQEARQAMVTNRVYSERTAYQSTLKQRCCRN